MLTRSNSSPTPSPSPTLSPLLNSKMGGILMFLLLAIGFITTAKLLVDPLMVPAQPNQPELTVDQPESVKPETLRQSAVDCPPTALAACLTS